MDSQYFDDLMGRVGRLVATSELDEVKRLVEVAGTDGLLMLKSREKAASFLRSDVPALQCAAIQVLTWFWRISPTSQYAIDVLELAKNSQDDKVRREALSFLGIIYAGTDDIEVGELLARTVLDEGESTPTRKAAYDGLRLLRFYGSMDWRVHGFPETVEWSYVKTFLDKSRISRPVDPLNDPRAALRRLSGE